LAPATTAQASPAAPDAAAGGLPLEQLRRNDADLALNIGDLTVGGQHVEDLQAHLQLQDGKLALNPFRAETPEGAIVGGASIDASSDVPPVAVTLRSPSISADAVAGLLGYPGGAHGTMQVDAQLSGAGQTVAAVKATLNGHLGLAMVGGQVDDSLVQGLIGDALNAAGTPAISGGTSQVRCFAARLDFQNGVGQVRVLATDTSKLTLDGSGQIDLATRTVDLHLRPRVRLGPTEIAAPVSLRGPIGDVKATLDPVLGGGRVGVTIGGGSGGSSGCAGDLAIARAGLGGPMPTFAAPTDPGLVIRKPKDLLKGLFH
jgi:AsmA protein